MQKLLHLFILTSILTVSAYSEEIDNLLTAYEKASELSNKTKDEAAGNLIVYTRDDLERMQANTLKDIIKSLRFFHYAENRMGQPDMLNQDPVTYYSKSVRLYLNDNELYTPLAGSGFVHFGDMELDFIDHIEIYEGFPSFDFGIEPATIVIRLYSKTAEHDAGGRIRAQGGTYGANLESAYYADEFDGLSYFAYASRYDNERKEFSHDGETLKRNARKERVFASIASENHRLDIHGYHQKGDAFLGTLVGATPQETATKARYISVASHSTFQDKTVTLDLSFLNKTGEYDFDYAPTNPALTVRPGIGTLALYSLDQQSKEDSYTAGVKKTWHFEEHTLSGGIQFRHKHFDSTDTDADIYLIDPPPPTPFPLPTDQPYYSEDVYSLFLQDEYSIDEHQMVTFSLMGQHYHRKQSSVDDQETFQGRLGYIYTDEHWVAKTFLSHQEFSSEPYMTTSTQYGNADLDKEAYYSIFQEFAYHTDTTLTKLVLGYGKNEDTPILDADPASPTYGKMINSDKNIYGHSAALEQTFFFREKDKLELQISTFFLESPVQDGRDARHHMGVIRMLNSFGNFDLFNELIIHEGYAYVSNGHDYSAGVRYHPTRDLTFNIKGENIFDDGLEWDYMVTPGNRVIVPVIERRFWAGVEYLF